MSKRMYISPIVEVLNVLTTEVMQDHASTGGKPEGPTSVITLKGFAIE